jgi:hypothetical protein
MCVWGGGAITQTAHVRTVADEQKAAVLTQGAKVFRGDDGRRRGGHGRLASCPASLLGGGSCSGGGGSGKGGAGRSRGRSAASRDLARLPFGRVGRAGTIPRATAWRRGLPRGHDGCGGCGAGAPMALGHMLLQSLWGAARKAALGAHDARAATCKRPQQAQGHGHTEGVMKGGMHTLSCAGCAARTWARGRGGRAGQGQKGKPGRRWGRGLQHRWGLHDSRFAPTTGATAFTGAGRVDGCTGALGAGGGVRETSGQKSEV